MQHEVCSLISLKKSTHKRAKWARSLPRTKKAHKRKTTILWDKFIQWWTDTIKAMASSVYRALFKLLHKGQWSVENKWKHCLQELINGECLAGPLEQPWRGAAALQLSSSSTCAGPVWGRKAWLVLSVIMAWERAVIRREYPGKAPRTKSSWNLGGFLGISSLSDVQHFY